LEERESADTGRVRLAELMRLEGAWRLLLAASEAEAGRE